MALSVVSASVPHIHTKRKTRENARAFQTPGRVVTVTETTFSANIALHPLPAALIDLFRPDGPLTCEERTQISPCLCKANKSENALGRIRSLSLSLHPYAAHANPRLELEPTLAFRLASPFPSWHSPRDSKKRLLDVTTILIRRIPSRHLPISCSWVVR